MVGNVCGQKLQLKNGQIHCTSGRFLEIRQNSTKHTRCMVFFVFPSNKYRTSGTFLLIWHQTTAFSANLAFLYKFCQKLQNLGVFLQVAPTFLERPLSSFHLLAIILFLIDIYGNLLPFQSFNCPNTCCLHTKHIILHITMLFQKTNIDRPTKITFASGQSSGCSCTW